MFKHSTEHDIWDKNIDNIIVFKSGEQKINGRDGAGGEAARTNINKHSSSVSEASCFIWLGWGWREGGLGWKTEQSCSFAFLPSFPSSAIFSLFLMGMGSLGSGGGKRRWVGGVEWVAASLSLTSPIWTEEGRGQLASLQATPNPSQLLAVQGQRIFFRPKCVFLVGLRKHFFHKHLPYPPPAADPFALVPEQSSAAGSGEWFSFSTLWFGGDTR